MTVLLYIGLIVAGTAVVWKGSVLLEEASDRLAALYALPAVVEGGLVAAVGSSLPEFSSTILAILVHGEFELGVSTIVGSALFNILVIPGLSALVGKGLAVERVLVYKDAQFYLTAIVVLLFAFALAILYHPVPEAEWQGQMTRPIALLPLLLYGLYLFLQQQEVADPSGGVEASRPASARDTPGLVWRRLLGGIVLIIAGVEALVRSAIALGEIFATPTFLWGLTVIAIASSLPDALVSLRTAKHGAPVVSLSNVLGSNIFNLLVAIPVGVLLAGSSVIDFATMGPLMGALVFASIVLLVTMRTKLRLSRAEGAVLLGLYTVFVAWMVLETVGVTSVVR